MTAVRGSALLVKRYNGSTYATVGALQSKSLSINGNPIDVTTADDVDANNEVWQTFITGLKSLAINNANGIAKSSSKTVVQAVYDDFATGTVTSYQIVVPYLGTFEVDMIIGNMEFTGPHDGALGFTISMQSAGAPTFTAEA